MQVETNEEDVSVGLYGFLGLIQSSERPQREYLHVRELGAKTAGKTVWLRTRMHTSRAKGKQVFLVLRQQESTVQALANVDATTSRQFIKFLSK